MEHFIPPQQKTVVEYDPARVNKEKNEEQKPKKLLLPNQTQRTEIGLFLFDNPDTGFYFDESPPVAGVTYFDPSIMSNKRDMMAKWLKKNGIMNMVAISIKPDSHSCFMKMRTGRVVAAEVPFSRSESKDTRIKNIVTALFTKFEQSSTSTKATTNV